MDKQILLIPSDNELHKIAPWFCGCGSFNTKSALFEVLSCFKKSVGSERYFIDLKSIREVEQKHGEDFVCLLLYLLDHVGVIKHYGSVNSSSYLTADGEAILELLEEDEKGNTIEKPLL